MTPILAIRVLLYIVTPDNIVWPREFYEILDSHGLVG